MSYCVHAAVQEPETSTSAVPNLEAEADDLEVEDPGLYDLARRLTDNALQGEASLSPGPHPTAPVTAQHDRGKTYTANPRHSHENGSTRMIERLLIAYLLWGCAIAHMMMEFRRCTLPSIALPGVYELNLNSV